MYFRAIAVATLLIVAGCQTQQDQEDPMTFGRVDCQRTIGNPALTLQFEQDTAICQGRGDAAALSGTAVMQGGGILGAIDKGVTGGNINRSTVLSCMAERGYLYKRRSEHLSTCEAVKGQNSSQKAKPGPPSRLKLATGAIN